jgi:hypothetical protein
MMPEVTRPILLLVSIAVLLALVDKGGENMFAMNGHTNQSKPMDLSRYAVTAPQRQLQLLFIHHSCGGQLLAAPGPDVGTNCIYLTHPNGGGLRMRLEQNSYIVHEASYASRIGQNTDLFDWFPKFRNDMEQILTCESQDARYDDGHRNNIVVFKSCFPNNAFTSEGRPPGNAVGPDLTLWNAKAAYQPLLHEFRKHPEVLFVCVTAPPLAPKAPPQPLWKVLVKNALDRYNSLSTNARLAREFNNWLNGQDGWLMDSKLTNVAVFDYYDILTDHGITDLSRYPTGDGYDSHPSREGNEKAAEEFVPFLNRAARRAGLSLEKKINRNFKAQNEMHLMGYY